MKDASDSTLSATDSQRQPPTEKSWWLWLIPVPHFISRQLRRVIATSASLFSSNSRIVIWVSVAGVLPVLLAASLQVPCSAALTALLLVPLLLCAVSQDRTIFGIGLMVLVLLIHSGLVILWTALDPELMVHVTPSGAAYWEESREWILTGENPEYELQSWLPAHLQLLGGVVILNVLTLGGATLVGGIEQIDMMNYYVGQLLTHSSAPLVSATLGWHPWSVCRGIGYLFITFETVSLSLGQLAGQNFSKLPTRQLRWGIGLSFIVLDGIVKWSCMEHVRDILNQYYGL